jgi:hypothetical protein
LYASMFAMAFGVRFIAVPFLVSGIAQ